MVPPPGARADVLSLEVVRDTATLRALEPEWQDLADAAAEPNPFYEPWAALPALTAFGEGVEIVLLSRPHPSLRKGERQLCGLIPLQRRRASGLFGLTMLSLWRHPYTYLGVPLVRAGLERPVLSGFLDWLEQGGRQRGLLRVEDFPGDGPLRHALVDELSRRGWSHGVTQTYTRAFLRRGASADGYIDEVVPGKRRKEFRRQQQRLAEQGTLEFVELRPQDDLRAWAEEFSALEARGWKGKDKVSVASRAADFDYFIHLVCYAGQRGRVTGLALRLNGRAIAMKLNLLSRRGSMAFKITYDEEWAKYSPGVLLELENIRHLHEQTTLPWMDSCAAANRAMINRLWADRREMQTLLVATNDFFSSLVVSAMPLVRWVQNRLRGRLRRTKAKELVDGQ